MNTEHEEGLHVVVVNQEEQYSLWPAQREVPKGWTVRGGPWSKATALEYVERVWVDMRPLSLRRSMAGQLETSCSPGSELRGDTVLPSTSK